MKENNGKNALGRIAGKEGIGGYCKRVLSQKSDIVIVFLFLIVLMVITQAMNEKFLTFYNLRNLMASTLPYLLIAFAQMTVILLGGIDLSVGAVISVSVSICAVTMSEGTFGWVPGVLLAILVGTLAGLVNGVIIVKGRIQPIIATLATSNIIGGIAYLFLPSPGGYIKPEFAKFVTGYTKGWKFMPFLIFAVAILAMYLFLNRTRLGRFIYASGGNEEAAFSSGINVGKVKILAFGVCGMIASICGIYVAARTQSGDPSIGNAFVNNSIAASVIGGTALAGGRGSAIGTVAGALIIVVVNNMLNLLRVQSYYQYLVLGLMMVIALALSAIQQRARKG